MSPERKRRTVQTVRRRLGHEKASERRVCRVLGQPRATQRYQSKRAEQDKELLEEMRSIAAERPCFGSPQVYEARWLDRACVKTLFVAKSSPWENGYVESFNSRFRQELLDRELFLGLEDARWCVDRWRLDYNHYRPHSSLGYVPPAEFAARWPTSAPGPASATPQQAPPLRRASGVTSHYPDTLIQTGT